MNIYQMTVKYESLKEKIDDKYTLNAEIDGKSVKEVISEANGNFGVRCGLDGRLSAQIADCRADALEVIMCIELTKAPLKDARDCVIKFIKNTFAITKVKVAALNEISVRTFCAASRRTERLGYAYEGMFDELGFSYRGGMNYSAKEYFRNFEPMTCEEAIEKAKGMMADDSLLEEIERIYSPDNMTSYHGNPVHYHITAANTTVAINIIELLMRALKSQSRILGSRLEYIYNISEECTRETDIHRLFGLAAGNCVAIEMSGDDEDHGIYASSYHDVIDFFDQVIKGCQLNTLVFLVEISEKPGFARPFVVAVQDDIDLISIKEGFGSRDKAIKYFETLAMDMHKDIKPTTEEIEAMIPRRASYSASDVRKVYQKCVSGGLKKRVYKAYLDCDKVKLKDEIMDYHPYKVLKNMVGLTEVKTLVDQIINTAKIQKMRKSMGMDCYKSSLHMIFTGNPGSAKTTVARLIGEILKKEGVLEYGKMVECGRSDLVGQYVGWTAKQVRRKFKEAEGGILFIDEAYSLVDDSHSFGDEAINTIVQEMENHRDNVIVIFAGYPRKMEEFLERNEGLRSRIAFHLKFPDYKADEMLEIIKLMAKEKGLKLDSETQEKCFGIFKSACKNEEFGNGRFARNLLEQAILKQSDRIVKSAGNRKISKKALTTLIAEDFDVNAVEQYSKKAKTLGFVANL